MHLGAKRTPFAWTRQGQNNAVSTAFFRILYTPEGYFGAVAGLGNGTSTTDIETRPISPCRSSKVPLPSPMPVAGFHLVCGRMPTHSPRGCLNSWTVRFG